MKILLSIHHNFDISSGAPGSTLMLGREYEKLGHTVYYYSMDQLPDWIPRKLHSLSFPWFTAAHINKLLNEDKIDVIDASTGDAWVWETVFKKLSKNLPLLVTRSHGLEHAVHIETLEEARKKNIKLSWKYPIYHGGFRLWEVAKSLRCADIAFFLNHLDSQYAIQHLCVDPERAVVSPNGIPDSFLNLPCKLLEDSYDKGMGIVQIGTYIPRKGVQYSVPALNSILKRYPKSYVCFLGTCCTENLVYEDFEPEVRSRVKVIPKFTHNDLPSLLKGYHIKILSSLSEGFGKVLLEAMACGLVPISTKTPGPLEIIQDEYNGLLISTSDSKAIEESVDKLISNKALFHKLRCNAYNSAQKYSWKNIAEKRIEIYQKAYELSRLKK